MQSDPGAGTPHTGGDDEVWRELVARFEEADDAFMDDGGGPGQTKGVSDFDPLGVWQQQFSPAPREPAAGERAPDEPRPETERLSNQGHGVAGALSGPRDYEATDDLDDAFIPPELPSLAGSEPAIVLSWIGAAGGPLFLVFASIFWRSIPLFLVIGVIMAILAGTGYLLYRLPSHRDHDDGDGAVV